MGWALMLETIKNILYSKLINGFYGKYLIINCRIRTLVGGYKPLHCFRIYTFTACNGKYFTSFLFLFLLIWFKACFSTENSYVNCRGPEVIMLKPKKIFVCLLDQVRSIGSGREINWPQPQLTTRHLSRKNETAFFHQKLYLVISSNLKK